MATEKTYLEDIVKFELDSGASRSKAVLAAAAATDYAVGTVLGTITASGKKVPCDPDADDGSEVADAILVEHILPLDAAGDADIVVLDMVAMVNAGNLVFAGENWDNATKTAAMAQLRGQLIKTAEVYNG